MTAESPRPAATADQISPDDLLAGFAKSHLVRWFLAAFLLHAVVIGGFSMGTIRDWLDPEGAKARQEAALAAAKAASAPAETVAAPAAQPAEGQATSTTEAKPAEQQAAATTAAKTPIEKATTEAAKPEEIPSAPDDLGLSIEDTNPN